MRTPLVVLSVVLLQSFSMTKAQVYNQIGFTIENGLPDDNVTCFLRDQQGFLWIGTSNGLCRFDGTHFYTLPPGLLESNRIAGDLILDLEEDGNYIWASHRFGLTRINKNNLHCENFQSPISDLKYTIDRAIRDIYKDKKGNIWLAGNQELLRFDKKNNSIKQVWDFEKKRPGGSNSQVNKIIPAGEDQLLLLMVHGWVRFDIRQSKPDSILLRKIPASLMAGENLRLKSYWNTFAAYISIFYDTKSGDLVFETSDFKGFVNQVKNIYIDTDLTVYLNSEKKKVTIWKKDNTFIEDDVYDAKQMAQPLSEFNFGGFIDGLQCWGKPNGFFITDKSSTWSKKYFFSDQAGKVFNRNYEIRDVAEYDHQNYVIAANGGLFLMDRLSHQLKIFPVWKDSAIYTVYVMPDKTIWISTDQYVYHFNPVNGKIVHSDFIESYAMNISYDGKSIIVATRSSGILLIDPKSKILRRFKDNDTVPQVTFNRITSLKQIRRGSAFIITYNKLNQFSINDFIAGRYKPDSIPPSASVFNEKFAITAAHNGNKKLWIGLYVGGVLVYDSLTMNWVNYTTQTGLTSNYISEILEDEQERIWIVSAQGIDIYNPDKKGLYKYPFGFRTGGRTGGTNLVSGNLLFFDSEKILEIDPELFNLSTERKKVLLSQVVQDKDQLQVNGGLLKLPYNRNSLRIVFSLQKLEPGETKYRYKLKSGEDWIDIGKETNLSFASLEPGKYFLEINATDEFGQWSHFSDILSIQITPPFWMTAWFILLVAILLFLISWVIYQYRINQLKKLMLIRNKISQDLHDEVGATLSSIHVYSSVAEKSINDNPGKAMDALKHISQNTLQVMENMNDIVWAIKAGDAGESSLEGKLKNYGYELLTPLSIRCNYHIDKEAEKKLVNLEARKNILLIAKEAMNNIAKHSQATDTSVSLKLDNGCFRLIIKDNGCGIQKTYNKKGNGLSNMKQRTESMGGFFSLQSGQANGTLLECSIPLTSISN